MNKTRKQLLEAVKKIGERYPDWRFGQLVINVSGLTGSTVANIDDHDFLNGALHFLSRKLHDSMKDNQPETNSGSKSDVD